MNGNRATPESNYPLGPDPDPVLPLEASSTPQQPKSWWQKFLNPETPELEKDHIWYHPMV